MLYPLCNAPQAIFKLDPTLRFLVENQFVERVLVERGLVESDQNEGWWKGDIGGKVTLVERLCWWKD